MAGTYVERFRSKVDKGPECWEWQAKGRKVWRKPPTVRGEAHANAKLSEKSVREIRFLCDEGWQLSDVGNAYGVSEVTVGRIGKRKAWMHVEEAI